MAYVFRPSVETIHEDCILTIVESQERYLSMITGASTNVDDKYLGKAHINQQIDKSFDQKKVIFTFTKNFVGYCLSKISRASPLSIHRLINGLQSIMIQCPITDHPSIINLQIALHEQQNSLRARYALLMLYPMLRAILDEGGDDEFLPEFRRKLFNPLVHLDYKAPIENEESALDELKLFLDTMYI